MRIDRLHLTNFRCFDERTFAFHEQFTLLIGANATGKTAVLDALAVALGAALAPVPHALSGSIRRRDVRRTYRLLGETGYFVEHYPTRIDARGSIDSHEIDWTRTLPSAKSQTTRGGTRTIRGAMNRLLQRSAQHGDVILPYMGYYGTGRLWLERRLASRTSIDPAGRNSRYVGYRNCLAPRQSARHLSAWIKRLALLEVRRGPLTTLKAIFRAISMAATAADIAMRCSQLNPQLNESAGTETPGVVLIDEIDLHLHPRWQRSVVRDLTETFPRLQFVATTHSPFIVQSISTGGAINLDMGASAPETPDDQSIEDVAEDIMGVEQPQRSRRYRDMLEAAEQYYAALTSAAGETDPREVQQLRERLDQLEEPFADNPAYVAFLRLQRAAQKMQ